MAMGDSTYKWSHINELIYRAETLQVLENELTSTSEAGQWEKIDWEFGIDMQTRLYLKQITSKDLLYGTGNTAAYSVIT